MQALDDGGLGRLRLLKRARLRRVNGDEKLVGYVVTASIFTSLKGAKCKICISQRLAGAVIWCRFTCLTPRSVHRGLEPGVHNLSPLLHRIGDREEMPVGNIRTASIFVSLKGTREDTHSIMGRQKPFLWL